MKLKLSNKFNFDLNRMEEHIRTLYIETHKLEDFVSSDKEELGKQGGYEFMSKLGAKLLYEPPRLQVYSIDRPEIMPYVREVKDLRFVVFTRYDSGGQVPNFKNHIFTKSWLKDQLSVEDKDKDPVGICMILDATGNVAMSVVGRNMTELNINRWIISYAFDLFESEMDKLRCEENILYNKADYYSQARRRLELVRFKIQKLEDEIEDQSREWEYT
jgi:hypothetical protein